MYERPELPARYCATMCPIGQIIAHHYEKNNIATITLGLLKELEEVESVRPKLVSIAADGRLDDSERYDFKQALRELCELEKEIGELKQYATKQGIGMGDIMPNQKEKAVLAGAAGG